MGCKSCGGTKLSSGNGGKTSSKKSSSKARTYATSASGTISRPRITFSGRNR